MSRGRRSALLILLVALIGAAAFALSSRQPKGPAPRPPAERPTLLLVTSLPLVFGEEFSLQGGGSPALSALQKRYRVVPISVTDPAELPRGGCC